MPMGDEVTAFQVIGVLFQRSTAPPPPPPPSFCLQKWWEVQKGLDMFSYDETSRHFQNISLLDMRQFVLHLYPGKRYLLLLH